MRVAVLSGKGGTGKTLVSVNLSGVSPGSTYMDCDVEEPNGHLYFKPQWEDVQEVKRLYPQLLEASCDGCRICVNFCRFNALAFLNNKVRVYEDLCHGCNGCILLCPQKALVPKWRSIGQIRRGNWQTTTLVQGIMEPGEVSGVPVIEALLKTQKKYSKEERLEILDCPPGSACSVMESIRDADYCLLVAEPTLFGQQNLAMVHQLAVRFQKPVGVVLNKVIEGENPSEAYCLNQGLPILARIPYNSKLGRLNGEGFILVEVDETIRELFLDLRQHLEEEVARSDEKASRSKR